MDFDKFSTIGLLSSVVVKKVSLDWIIVLLERNSIVSILSYFGISDNFLFQVISGFFFFG